MKKFKSIVLFLLIMLCVVGAIGGIGYTIYYGQYVVAIGVAVLAYSAWPKIRDYIIGLTL